MCKATELQVCVSRLMMPAVHVGKRHETFPGTLDTTIKQAVFTVHMSENKLTRAWSPTPVHVLGPRGLDQCQLYYNC